MRLFTSVCVLLLASTAAFAQGQGKFAVVSTEIVGQPLGYHTFVPEAINNKGEVVGSGHRPDDEFGFRVDAFFWSRQTGFVLIASDAIARDINDHGDVAVAHWHCNGHEARCYFRRGSVWNGKEVRDLGEMYLFAINNRGDLAGHCPGPLAEVTSVPIWSDGSACAIRGGIFVEWTCRGDERYEVCGQIATDINQHGDIVGQRFANLKSDPAGTTQSWAVSFPGQGGTVVLETGTSASGINNRGTIVGQQDVGGSSAAVAWTRGGLQRLPGPQPSAAVAINDRNWILGANNVWIGATELPIALDGSAVDLNDRGQIVGTHSVIWTVKPAQSLHVETPNRPTRWGIGTVQRIAWWYDGPDGQFEIEVSRGDDSWETVATVENRAGTSQSFYWTVTGASTTSARIRVTATAEGSSDVNDVRIAIAEPFISILRPVPHEDVEVGSDVRIFLEHNLGPRALVAIDVTADEGASWQTITEVARTTGSTTSSFRWKVGAALSASLRLRVRALDGSGAVGVSDVFSVTGAGTESGDKVALVSVREQLAGRDSPS